MSLIAALLPRRATRVARNIKRMSDANKKRKKEPFVVRMKRRGLEFMALGKILVDQPKQFPRALLNFIRRSFRSVWDARGGGLYACGYVLTFVWLEIKMFVGDILSAENIGDYFGGQVFELLFRYFGDSLRNMISAFMWPASVVEFQPPWGVAALVIMFAIFPRWIKPALERWLFDDDEPAPRSADQG